MQIYANQFATQLSRGLANCYLIFGDEPQQKLEILDGIREHARQKGFTERTLLVADKEFSWAQLIEASQSMSLFADRQFIELELPTGKPGTEGSKILQELAPSLGQDILLLVHGPRVGKDVQRAKWFKTLDENGVHCIVYDLEGKNLAAWLQAKAQQHGLRLDHSGVRLLADFCEGNLLAAAQEITKLALLYPDGNVTTEQIEHALVDQSRFNVFQLTDELLAGNAQRAVKVLYRLESEGLEPTIIIWALVREWQTLHKLKEASRNGPISWQKFGIWRNRQGYYESALQRLNEQHLNALRRALSEADSAFKQSSMVRPYVTLCHLCLMIALPAVQAFPGLASAHHD